MNVGLSRLRNIKAVDANLHRQLFLTVVLASGHAFVPNLDLSDLAQGAAKVVPKHLTDLSDVKLSHS